MSRLSAARLLGALRLPRSAASGRPSTAAPDAPHYTFAPLYGDPTAAYQPVDWRTAPFYRPELPAVFLVDVVGTTASSGMRGGQFIAWRTPAGADCLILGTWSDGSVHVKWRPIPGRYWMDGRFPSWVVERRQPQRDERVLPSNVRERAVRRRDPRPRLAQVAFLTASSIVLAVGAWLLVSTVLTR